MLQTTVETEFGLAKFLCQKVPQFLYGYYKVAQRDKI